MACHRGGPTGPYHGAVDWPAIALDSRVAGLAKRHVAVRGIGPDNKQTLVLVSFGRLRNVEVTARIGDTATREPQPTPQQVVCPGSSTLRDVVLAHTAVRASGAAEPPRIAWPGGNSTLTVPGLVALAAIITIVAVLLGSPLPMLLAIPLVGGAIATRGRGQLLLPPAVIERWQMLPSQVLARTPHEADAVGPTPHDRVGVVKAAYGELMGDIVYRIENSALFDAAHPTTNRFQVALLSWDPLSGNAARMAAEIEDTFAEARRDAERLGLDHLPMTARSSARRAAKAATTALSEAPAAERAAALARAEDILGSLALYYLPTVDRSTPSLIGVRRAIEPRP